MQISNSIGKWLPILIWSKSKEWWFVYIFIFVSVCADWRRSTYTHKPLYSPALYCLLKWPPRSRHLMWTTLLPMPSTPRQHLSTTLMPLHQVSWAMATPTTTSPAQPPAPLRCTRPSPMRPLLPPLPSSSIHHSSICNPSACSEGQTSQVSFSKKNMRIKTIALSHQDLLLDASPEIVKLCSGFKRASRSTDAFFYVVQYYYCYYYYSCYSYPKLNCINVSFCAHILSLRSINGKVPHNIEWKTKLRKTVQANTEGEEALQVLMGYCCLRTPGKAFVRMKSKNVKFKTGQTTKSEGWEMEMQQITCTCTTAWVVVTKHNMDNMENFKLLLLLKDTHNFPGLPFL